MKRYTICNYGCDDYTKFTIALSNDEYKTIIKLFDLNLFIW